MEQSSQQQPEGITEQPSTSGGVPPTPPISTSEKTILPLSAPPQILVLWASNKAIKEASMKRKEC